MICVNELTYSHVKYYVEGHLLRSYFMLVLSQIMLYHIFFHLDTPFWKLSWKSYIRYYHDNIFESKKDLD